MRIFDSRAAFHAAAGSQIGSSDWVTMDQGLVDTFAEATGDHQWIHVDVARASNSPFGGTVAHGYLTLSMVVPLMAQVAEVRGESYGLNYGLNRVRFPAPVPVGSRIRAHVSIHTVQDVTDGGVHVEWRVTIEVEGQPKPACVAEPITRYYYPAADGPRANDESGLSA